MRNGKKTSWVLTKIRTRMTTRNRNYLGVIVGETGSGKSYTAIRMAEVIDPNFSIDNIVFTAEDFLELIASKKLKKGSIIVWEEAGVGYSARKWYSQENEVTNNVLQIFRVLNYGVIYTTPDKSFVDKIARNLFHAVIRPLRIDYKKKLCWVKYLQIQRSEHKKEPYLKYFRKTNKRLTAIPVNLPQNKELLKQYEKMKKAYVKKVIEQSRTQLKQIKEQKEVKKKIFNKKEKADEWIEKFDGKVPLTLHRVSDALDISTDEARRVIAHLQNRLVV